MNDKTELPAEVIEAIHANRKIEAIKLLRERADIELKEAKDMVDAYIREHPQFQSSSRQSATESGIGRVIYIVLIIIVLYVAYRYFS